MRNKTLIGFLLLLLAMAVNAAPNATQASYDLTTHQLTITFSEPVVTDSAYVRIGYLRIDDDDNGPNPDFTFAGASYFGNGSQANLSLGLAYDAIIDQYDYEGPTGTVTAYCWGKQTSGVQAFESMSNRSTMRLHLEAGFAINAANELSDATPDTGILIHFVPVSDPLTLLSAEYRAQTNELVFHYNRPVKFDVIAEDRVMPNNPGEPPLPGNRLLDFGEDRNLNGVLDIEPNLRTSQLTISSNNGVVALSGGEVTTKVDTADLAIRLSIPNRRSVEFLNPDSLEITIPPFTVFDTGYRTGNSVRSAVVNHPETATLQLDSVSYDWGNNRVKLSFNRELEGSTDNVLFGRIALGGRIENRDTVWALNGGSANMRDNNTGVEIELLPSDQQNVEALALAYPPMRLVLNRGAVLSLDGNDNLALESNVNQIVETPASHAPTPTSATYDANTNKLTIVFDLRISDRAGRGDVTVTGFGVSDGTHERYLSGGTYRRVSSNSGIEVAISDSDEVRLETLGNKSGWKLRMLPFSVLQLTRLNGNRPVVSDSINVLYVADTTAPLLQEVFVDRHKGTAILQFTEAVSPAQLLANALTIAGRNISTVQLDTNDRRDTVLSRFVYLALSASDAAGFHTLSNDQLIDPSVSLAAGSINNLDGIGNPAWSDLRSGTVLQAGANTATFLAGIGRSFWVKSNEAFPTSDRWMAGYIRKTGVIGGIYNDTIDLYVSAELLRPYAKNNNRIPITQARIDSLWRFAAERSLTDTTKSAYQMVAELAARGVESLLPTRTSIFWVDILDEFNLGRNDTKKEYFRGSFANPNDALRQSETTAHTNELPMVYLDGWPQTVNSTDTSWYYDTSVNPAVWRNYTTAGRTAYNGLANVLLRLFSYSVDRFEQGWIFEGMSQMAELEATGKTEFYGGGTPQTPSDKDARSLTFVGTGLKIKDDFFNINLFFNYLREQFGGAELFKRLATSRLTGIAAVETTLVHSQDIVPLRNRGLTLADAYLNYATAALLDTTNGHDSGLFKIESAFLWGGIISKNGTAVKWKSDPATDRPPYSYSLGAWSFSYYFIYWDGDTTTLENPLLDVANDQLVLNAVDDLGVRARLVWIPSELLSPSTAPDFETLDFSFNNVRSGSLPLSTTINGRNCVPGSAAGQMKVLALIVVKSDVRPPLAQGDILVTNRSTSPDVIGFAVQPDPVSNRHLSLWVAASEPLFTAQGVETPETYLYRLPDSSRTIYPMTRQFFANIDITFSYLYSSRVFLEAAGDYSYQLVAIGANGNRINIAPISMHSMLLPGGENFVWEDGELTAPANLSLGTVWQVREAALPIPASPTTAGWMTAPLQTEVCHIGPDRNLSEPATLSLTIPEHLANTSVAIYRDDAGVWKRIGGEVQNGAIRAKVLRLGRFAVLPATLAAPDAPDANLPLTIAIGEAYPNPFNGAVILPIALPESAPVKLTVFNVLGRAVATVDRGVLPAGRHSILWNGDVASGVYFARISAGSAERTMKLVRVQ